MTRLTDGLSSGPTGLPRVPSPQRVEAKRFAQRSRYETNTPAGAIAAVTGRPITCVYDALNINDKRRQLTYADLIAMSRHTSTKQFVVHLLQPIEQGIRGEKQASQDPKDPSNDGKR